MVATVVVVVDGDGDGAVVDVVEVVEVVEVVDGGRRGAIVVVVDAIACDRGLELPHPAAATTDAITTRRNLRTSIA